MRVTAVLLAALTAFAANGSAQAVPEGIAPEEGPPEGCETSVDGNFTIGIALLAKRHRRESAQEVCHTCSIPHCPRLCTKQPLRINSAQSLILHPIDPSIINISSC